MCNAFAFSGPRRLSEIETDTVYNYLDSFSPRPGSPIFVGDADGVDRIIRLHYECQVFEVEGGNKPSDFAKRTIAMLRTLRQEKNPCLIAFPNKPCPVGCVPGKFSGKGSGTWLAIATAKFLCIEIEIIKLGDFDLPNWIFEKQLSLF